MDNQEENINSLQVGEGKGGKKTRKSEKRSAMTREDVQKFEQMMQNEKNKKGGVEEEERRGKKMKEEERRGKKRKEETAILCFSPPLILSPLSPTLVW